MYKSLLALSSWFVSKDSPPDLQKCDGTKKSTCPFGFTSGDSGVERVYLGAEIQYPYQIYPEGIPQTLEMSQKTYQSIVHDIIMHYESLEKTVNAKTNVRGEFVGCVLRQAGHDFMDYRPEDQNIGGSDGCINYDDPDNRGLTDCVLRYNIPQLYKPWADKVSLADFLVLLAEAAIGRTATDQYHLKYDKDNYFRSGTFAKQMQDSFKFGRKTTSTCEWNHNRMPNPEHGCEGRGTGKPGLQQIFVENIWKGHEDAWTLTTAINGAHTVGRAKLINSGYDGFWSDPESSGIFNNDYYWSMMFKGWGPKLAVNGNKEKNQWKRVDMLSKQHEEMMLTTDMCTSYKNNNKFASCNEAKWKWDYWIAGFFQNRWECTLNFYNQGVDLDPTFKECCAWQKLVPLNAMQVTYPKINNTGAYGFCGVPHWSKSMKTPSGKRIGQPSFDKCCGAMGDKRFDSCDHRYWGTGPAYQDNLDFMRDEQLWLRTFLKAWHIATENGNELTYLRPDKGPNVLEPNALARFDCMNAKKSCKKYPDKCFSVTWQVITNVGDQYVKKCFNYHRTVSSQIRESQQALGSNVYKNWQLQWESVVYLSNPRMSSSYKTYTAERVLRRQNGWENKKTMQYYRSNKMPYDWGVHAHLGNNPMTQSSCAITAEDQSKAKDQYWEADFVGGKKTIKRVVVTMSPDNSKGGGLWVSRVSTMQGYEGIKVYIDDQICGTLDTTQIMDQFPNRRGYQGEFMVDCAKPLKGRTVSVRRDGRMMICDVIPMTEINAWTTGAWRSNAKKREKFSGV